MTEPFRVLVLVNSGVSLTGTNLPAWRDYELEKLGLNLDITLKTVDLNPLKHKSFGIRKVQNNEERELYGLDGIKDKVRALNLANTSAYHSVIFLYDVESTAFWINNLNLHGFFGHWTYFEPIYPGTFFTEIMTTKAWIEKGDLLRVLTHEIRHVIVARLRRLGLPVPDVMDATPVRALCVSLVPNPAGACSVDVPYHKEFDINAKDGNRAVQDGIFKSGDAILRVEEQPELTNYIRTLTNLVAELSKKIAAMFTPKESPRLAKWAEAIKRHEGWFVGSRSHRNLNPGNFRNSPYVASLGSVGSDPQGFAIFPSYEKGFEALLQFLRDARANSLKSYRAYAIQKNRPGNMCTLGDFFAVYAPSSDGNNPLKYAQVVADYIGDGVEVGTPINKI